jgi:hypothetical protein
MEAVYSSGRSTYLNETAWHHNTEYDKLNAYLTISACISAYTNTAFVFLFVLFYVLPKILITSEADLVRLVIDPLDFPRLFIM